MEDGLKLGILAGVIIYLLRQRETSVSDWSPPDIQYSRPIPEPAPDILPPPNVDGCLIPETTSNQEAILKDPASCAWIVRTKTTLGELAGQEQTYDPYLDSAYVPINPLENVLNNL